MSCNNPNIANQATFVVTVPDNNTITITDMSKHNVVTAIQQVSNIIQINTPGPQGTAGREQNTGSLLLTSSFNSWTGSSTSQFAGTASYSTTSSYSISSSYAFSSSYALSSSYAISSSYTVTSSYSISSSYANSSSYAESSSYALSASYAFNSTSASYSLSSSYAISSSYAVSASYSSTASYVNPLNQNVTITGSILMTGSSYISGVDYVQFDTTAVNTSAVGKLYWNDVDGTLELGLKGGVVKSELGQGLVTRVVNKTSPLVDLLASNYQVVVVSGAQGQRLAVKLAQADNDANSAGTLGIVAENIARNQEGFVVTVGLLKDINTTGTPQGENWNDGDILYLSPTTAGAITKVKPQAPQHTVIIGYVEYAHQNNGKIYVKIDNGYEIDELHNVRINGVTYGDLLMYDTNVWYNTKQLSGSYTITGSLTISGSSTFTNIGPTIFSGSVTSTSGFTGSFSGSYAGTISNATTASYITSSFFTGVNAAQSASYALTASYALNGGGSGDTSGLVTTSSFNAFTSSVVSTSSFNNYTSSTVLTSSFNSFTSSVVTTSSFNNFTASVVTTSSFNSYTSSVVATSSFNSFTSSIVTTSSFNIFTSSVTTTSSFNTYTASAVLTSSFNAFTSSVVTTSSFNLFTQSINNATSSFVQNNQTSSFVKNDQTSSMLSPYALTTQLNSYLTTGSSGNIQTISGSLTINQNLTVLGSQSVQYITSSQLNISTNLITVNVSTPSVRFGGLAVIDSGSLFPGSGSFLYDSVQDEFLFVHRGDGSSVTSSHFLVGPQTYNNLGDETYISNNSIIKSQGNEHVTSSNITDTGTLVSINSNTQITGSLIAQSITGSLQGTASWATNAITSSTTDATLQKIINNGAVAIYDSDVILSGSNDTTITMNPFVGQIIFRNGNTSLAYSPSSLIFENLSNPNNTTTIDFNSEVRNKTATIPVSGGVLISAVNGNFANKYGYVDSFPYTGSAIITGSLIVTGSTISTLGFTGSLFGTASYATTASYALNGGGGGGEYTIVPISTTPYNATQTSGDIILLVDATGGTRTVNLPTAIGNKAKFTIKKIDTGTNTVTVDADGTQTIDGGLTALLQVPYVSITLISDNSNWFII